MCPCPRNFIVQSEDMNSEMSTEVLEIVTSAVDKFLATENYEASATLGVVGDNRRHLDNLQHPCHRCAFS